MDPKSKRDQQKAWQESKAERQRQAGLLGHRVRVLREGPEYWRNAFEKGRALGSVARWAKPRPERYHAWTLLIRPADYETLKALSEATGLSAAALVRACLARSLRAVVGAHRRARGDEEALKRFAERVVRDSSREWDGE